MTLHSFHELEEEEPSSSSPIIRRRSLRGESIRCLRELLDETIISSVSSSLPDDDLVVDDSSSSVEKNGDVDSDQKQQQQQKSKQGEDSNDELLDDSIITGTGQQQGSATTTATTAAAVTAAAAGRRRRHADKVRSRLLQNLGIQKPQPQQQHQGLGGGDAHQTGEPLLSNPPPNNNNRSSSSEPWGPTIEVPLNDTLEEEEDEQPTKRKRVLHFNPTVVVYTIPSFRVYSNRIRQTIWTNAAQLQEMVTRNSLEFSYEQWDASRVLDENTGLFFHAGEWIHPVHVEFLRQEDLEEQKRIEATVVKTSDEFWNQTCQRLGIQPAEFYHSLQQPTALQKQPTAH